MDLGVDANALVYAHVEGLREHEAYRGFIEAHLARSGNILVLSPIVCHEWLHVVTDPRRFERPLTIPSGIQILLDYAARGNVRVPPVDATVLVNGFDLLATHRLGRKRIADSLLAALLRKHGVRDLLTRNRRDFSVFDFLTIHDPAS